MKIKIYLLRIALTYLLIIPSNAIAAEKITFSFLIFTRSIDIEEIEAFSKSGHSKGFLKQLIKREEKEGIQKLLLNEYKSPIELTSRLLYSDIGEVILKRLSKIIYPFRLKQEKASVLALKASTIKAIDKDKETITLLKFLKAYPSKVIAIDVTELVKVMNKVESMNELIDFFTDSPLKKLKNEPN